MDTESPEGAALDEFIETNNLHQLIEEPTNIRNDSMTCIDLIITDQPNLFVNSGVHPSLDEHCQHQIIFGKLNISVPSPPPYKRLVWDYGKADAQAIRNQIHDIDWNTRFFDLDVETMAEVFTNTLYSLFLNHIPNRVLKIDDKDPPWINHSIKTAIKRKHRVYRKFLDRGRRQEDWALVKEARYEASKMIIDAKDKYFRNLGRKLADPNQGAKTYWATLNRLINKKSTVNIPPLLENGLLVTNFESKATIFNEYFVSQCSETRTRSTLPTFLPRGNSFLGSVNIDTGKVLKMIRSLDPKKAHGCDEISVSMIKMCDNSVVTPSCTMFKTSIETGVYPSIWKKANIIPIHKKNNRQCKNNHRPISLLPIFSKIFEKPVFDEIYDHLSIHGLLTDKQSGFRPGDSTVNQLISITHQIYKAFDEVPSKETRAVFLDLLKAFDRVWHEGLIYKLQCNGISGDLLVLLKDFLKNRKQRVVLNGKSSDWLTVSAGVPQGSVLGPLFFLIYINDLVENVSCDVRLFADDTSLFSVVNDVATTAFEMNYDLEKIKLWAWQWKMQFNTEKTEEVIFSTKRIKPDHPPLKLGDDVISQTLEHKHLGMVLDSKLDFKSHLREAIVKARRGIGMMKHLSRYVSRDVLIQLYKLYVRPHLDYGDIIYHKYDPSMRLDFTNKLEQTQYAAALAATGAWKGTSRDRLYQELGWETLYDRRWFRRLCHFFNVRKLQSPSYLFSEIPPVRPVLHNLRHSRIYDQSAARTTRFSNTYFYNTLFEWNSLNEELKNSSTLAEFKRKLITRVRPEGNPIYGIANLQGIRLLTKCCLEFSSPNEHKFRHNFDCLNPFCNCGMAKEDNEHFFLHCPHCNELRQNLLGQLSRVLNKDALNLDPKELCHLMLYGSPSLSVIDNGMVLEATIQYIENSERFK